MRSRPDTNSSNQFAVGSKAFVFDQNRRVYERTPDGKSTGGPIYREHFREVTITEETSRSWLVGESRPLKYPKKCPALFTAEQVEDACWRHDHRVRIIDLVQRADAEQLRK